MARPALIIAFAFLAAVAGLDGQAPAVPPAGTGLIVGRVVDAGGASLPAGVIVALSGAGVTTRRVLVDPQGRFLFSELPAGGFTITATKSGYLDSAFGKVRPDGVGHPLTLKEGEHVTNAIVKMWRFATISGTVTDDADDPVSARIQVLMRTVVAGRWRFVNSNIGANADDHGYYRVTGLVPGEYAVVITSFLSALPASLMEAAVAARQSETGGEVMKVATTNGTLGLFLDIGRGAGAMRVGDMLLQTSSASTSVTSTGAVRVYPTVWYPAAPSLGQATLLKLKAGDNRSGIDIRQTLMATARVTGHVSGPDGPVPFLALRLVPATLDDVSAEVTSSPALSFTVSSTASDPNGDFTFMAVPPGPYLIRAITSPPRPPNDSAAPSTIVQMADGMTSSILTGPPVPPMVTREPTLWTATPVAVGDTDMTGVSVQMRPGLRVAGRVEFDGTAPRPTAGELRATRVSLEPADGQTVWYPTAYQGQIDPAGGFYTIGVVAGKYVLRVEGLPKGWSVKSAMVGGSDMMDRPITLETKDVDGLILTLTDQPSGLMGSVRGADIRANDDAAVLVFPADGVWTNLGPSARRLRSARPTGGGSFLVSGLPPGEYNVIAIGDEFSANWQAPDFLEKLARVAKRVTILDRQTAQVDLTVTPIRQP